MDGGDAVKKCPGNKGIIRFWQIVEMGLMQTDMPKKERGG
jgi:hypothetical protein